MKKIRERLGIYPLRTIDIVIIGMLMAAILVVKMYTVKFIPNVSHYSFNFIPVILLAKMYGPTVGLTVGFLTDNISFFMLSTGSAPYFFGYTFNEMIAPFIYGLFLYRRNSDSWRIILSIVLVGIFVNMFLGTLWVGVLRGTPFNVDFVTRFPANISRIVANSIIMLAVLKAPIIDDLIRRFAPQQNF